MLFKALMIPCYISEIQPENSKLSNEKKNLFPVG